MSAGAWTSSVSAIGAGAEAHGRVGAGAGTGVSVGPSVGVGVSMFTLRKLFDGRAGCTLALARLVFRFALVFAAATPRGYELPRARAGASRRRRIMPLPTRRPLVLSLG